MQVPQTGGVETLPHAWFGDDGPPLLLIPGLGGKGRSWEPFLSSAAERFRTLVFDPPGSGRAAPLQGPVTIRDLAGATLDLLDRLGIVRTAVVGRSMGGMIAQELALLAPERISRLVLVSTTPRVDRHLAEVFRLWARMADLGVPADVRHKSAMLWCLGSAALERCERTRAYLRAKASSDRPADYAHQARACAGHDALDRLPALRIPTLVVAGADDRLTPVCHAERLAGAIPGARLTVLPETGHLPYVEASEQFARDVLEFLANEAPRTAAPYEEERPCPTASTLS